MQKFEEQDYAFQDPYFRQFSQSSCPLKASKIYPNSSSSKNDYPLVIHVVLRDPSQPPTRTAPHVVSARLSLGSDDIQIDSVLHLGHYPYHYIGVVRESSRILEATRSVSGVHRGLHPVPLQGQVSTYPRYFFRNLARRYSLRVMRTQWS